MRIWRKNLFLNSDQHFAKVNKNLWWRITASDYKFLRIDSCSRFISLFGHMCLHLDLYFAYFFVFVFASIFLPHFPVTDGELEITVIGRSCQSALPQLHCTHPTSQYFPIPRSPQNAPKPWNRCQNMIFLAALCLVFSYHRLNRSEAKLSIHGTDSWRNVPR